MIGNGRFTKKKKKKKGSKLPLAYETPQKYARADQVSDFDYQ
jgi:hypothetical protein